MTSNKSAQILIWIIFVFTSLFYFLITMNSSLNSEEITNYIVILVCYIVSAFVFLITAINNNLYLFEPISIATSIYFFMFVYYPLRDINLGTKMFFTQDFTEGTIKASIIVMSSYIAMLFGYYYKRKYHYQSEEQTFAKTNDRTSQRYVKISIILWVIGLISNLVFIMSSGKNLMYILTLGKGGAMNSELSSSSPLGFVGMIGYLMIASFLYIMIFGKSKILKIVLFLLTLDMFLVKGFRYVVVVILISPIIYYYSKKRKNPKLITVVLLTIILLVMITLLGSFRNDIQSGTSNTKLTDITINTLDYVLSGNFGQYKAFYIMVDQIPKNYSYTYGVKTFINPLIMFIPRIIWKGKTFLGTESGYFLSQEAISAGSAYCNIGEFYMDFGAIGCIIAMFFEGYIFAWTKKWVNDKNISVHGLIAYSISTPLVLQIIIRGYMASNFNLVLFSLLPVFICSHIHPESNENDISA